MRLIPNALALPCRAMLTAAALAMLALPAAAQSPFSPRIYVNNSAVTQYELDQRMRFMEALGGTANPEKAALDALVEDRLYQIAAKAAKITVTDAQLTQGLTDFASRGNMTVDQFKARMAAAGVAEETLRDFVRSGLLWREVVRARYAGRVDITNSEVDRAMQAEAQRPAMEIAISEIILPMVEPYRDQSLEIAALIEEQVHGPELFAEAASRFSASRSRERGGALDWMPEARLPPLIAGPVQDLGPGQITGRIEVPNALAFFMVRGRREGARPDPASLTVDYAELRLPAPDAAGEAARLAANADDCDDLHTLTGNRPGVVARQSMAARALAPDVSFELARLDPGETATIPAADGLRFLMLCSRTPTYAEPPTREQVRERLLDERVGAMARSYLAELRSRAIIRRP